MMQVLTDEEATALMEKRLATEAAMPIGVHEALCTLGQYVNNHSSYDECCDRIDCIRSALSNSVDWDKKYATFKEYIPAYEPPPEMSSEWHETFDRMEKESKDLTS